MFPILLRMRMRRPEHQVVMLGRRLRRRLRRPMRPRQRKLRRPRSRPRRRRIRPRVTRRLRRCWRFPAVQTRLRRAGAVVVAQRLGLGRALHQRRRDREAPGPGGGAGPRMGPNAPGMQGGPGGGMSPGNMAGGPRMGPGSPGMQPQPDPNKMMAGMQNAMQQQMKNRGGAMMQPGPGGGGMGGPGGNAADTGPVDTHSPQGVVKAFLGALKSKDADRLVEATARRTASEATSSANRELFGKILEVSLSDSEMDDLAKKLDGYKISGENPPRSTAKVDVVIQKSGPNGSYMRRRVTTRHEKKGWGVLDISGEQVFKSIGARPGARKSSSR